MVCDFGDHGVCLEEAVIILSCMIFSALLSAEPTYAGQSAVDMVWSYTGEAIFIMLVLVTLVKGMDWVVREMSGR